MFDGIEKVSKKLGRIDRDDSELMGGPTIETSRCRSGTLDFLKQLSTIDVINRDRVLLEDVVIVLVQEVLEKGGGLSDIALVDLMPGLSDHSIDFDGLDVDNLLALDVLSNSLQGWGSGSPDGGEDLGLAGLLLLGLLSLLVMKLLGKVMAFGPLLFVEVGSKLEGDNLSMRLLGRVCQQSLEPTGV